MHTCYSDGIHSPVYMAARCREIGLDFAAITDHLVYSSSLVAIDEARKHGFDILLFPGEEINYDLGIGHIVAIDADRLISAEIDYHNGESIKIIDSVYNDVKNNFSGKKMLPGTDRKLFGYFYGVVKKIREAGGLAIVAHPFWVFQATYDLARNTYKQILKDKVFDAIELFGAMGFSRNIISISYIQHYRENNPEIPLLGNSDAHDAYSNESDKGQPLGEIWSVVFAEKLERKAILKAIRGCMSVPCFKTNGMPEPVIVDPHDLVEYTYFLEREFFPRHDEICSILGGLYKTSLSTGSSFSGIKQLQNELDNFYSLYFFE